ncbi:LysR family transcriptional regulator [Desulfuromonas thiophila]|uniref:Transcriptional regulator, LysR family n=1 Tax=Desulfuromonas thiophila TaxID=57664 RepID=A0A1G6ZS42_9BACT|nr:LysR family transcriptional regulator [Desulfuromonas thiophila]SDE05047.1 transcriptional regulator, LysR family [Desulfuromonas thiophila]
METQYLRTLLIAASEGSFSRAAEKLHLTQSAVSQRAKSLEACCGTQLFDRSGSSLMPTTAGLQVLDAARRILDIEDAMFSALRQLQQRRRLSICCTAAFGVAHLPEVLKIFMPLQADIDDLRFLFSTPAQALEGLRGGEFDVAIIEHLADLDFGPLHTLPLPQDEMIFVSAPALQLPAGSVRLEQLYPHSLITRRDGCSCHDLLSRNLSQRQIDFSAFRKVLMLDDYGLMLREVLSGQGIAFLSRSVALAHLANGHLREHRVKGFDRVRLRSLVARSCSENPLQHAFMTCVLDYFAAASATS